MRMTRRTMATLTTAMLAVGGLSAATAPAHAATPSFLFTVQAMDGSTVPGRSAKVEDEHFTLTLRNVSPVTKFADRPFRTASVISPAALVSNWEAWFADSPPNAVLTFASGTHNAPQSIVVTLATPRYDSSGRTLSFTASRTYRTLDPSQKGKSWKRPATPRDFTSASLFIDDAGSSVTDGLVAQLQQAMQQYVFAPNDQNTWAAVVNSFSSILTQAWAQGTLNGSAASDAFSVTCQPTAQQILNGYLTCAVSMQLADGATFSTTLTQMMGASG